MKKRFAVASMFLAAVAGTSQLALADTIIYDSQGFELPVFSTGPLYNGTVNPPVSQDNWVSVPSDGGSATVEKTIYEGQQGVQLTRTTKDQHFFPLHGAVTPATTGTVNNQVTVRWDMYVPTQTTNTNYGPFFGIEAYDASSSPVPRVIGGFGVDGTTGEVLFEDPSASPRGALNTLANDMAVSFNAWHSYEMVLDFATRKVLGYIDGTLVNTANGFVDDPGVPISQFSDADLVALAAQLEPPTQIGSAYFDNYSVSINAVPEPAALSLIGLTGGLLLARRRSRVA